MYDSPPRSAMKDAHHPTFDCSRCEGRARLITQLRFFSPLRSLFLTKVPWRHRRYPVSSRLRTDPPSAPTPPDPRGLRVGFAAIETDFPCCSTTPCAQATTPTPADGPGRSAWVSQVLTACSSCQLDRRLHCPFRGLLSVHSCGGLCARSSPFRDRFLAGSDGPVARCRRSDCYRLKR